MPVNPNDQKKEFDKWIEDFTKNLHEDPGTERSWSDLTKSGCNMQFIQNQLFQYVSIQEKQSKTIRNDFKVMRKRVLVLCRQLLKGAEEMRELGDKKMYGAQSMLSLHQRRKDSIPESLGQFEDFPGIIEQHAIYMAKLFEYYRDFGAPWLVGRDVLLVIICEHIKSYNGGKPRYDDLANLLWAAQAACGKDKIIYVAALTKRIERYKSKVTPLKLSWEALLGDFEGAMGDLKNKTG